LSHLYFHEIENTCESYQKILVVKNQREFLSSNLIDNFEVKCTDPYLVESVSESPLLETGEDEDSIEIGEEKLDATENNIDFRLRSE